MAIAHYSEVTFAIDLIADAYHTTDVVKISSKIKEILNIEVTNSQVMDYLTHTEDFEKTSNTVEMRHLFHEQIPL